MLKKGSQAAKNYMAKLRAAKGKNTPKKMGAKPLDKYTEEHTYNSNKILLNNKYYYLSNSKLNIDEIKKHYILQNKGDNIYAINPDTNFAYMVYKKLNKTPFVKNQSDKTIGSIDLNTVGKELQKLQNDILELGYLSRQKKSFTIKEISAMKKLLITKKDQFKNLKLYLNSIAKFR